MSPSRRNVLEGGFALGALAFSASACTTIDSSGAPAGVTATTARGRLLGTTDRGVCVFRGVPYAGSVSAPEARFRAPPPAPSWTGVRNATMFGPPAIQPNGGPTGREPAASEDCLVLNVWTPVPDDARRPVMFYCHGGGFTIGSGGRAYQDGANLARQHDVVVVESNHRLGVFGYLYLGELLGSEYEGNQGLLDLVAALAWVHENIAGFGGDPDNVMVFGESGGGGKATCLYGMPAAEPYFHRASIESAIGPNDWSPDQATDVARQAMAWFDVADPRRLLEVPMKQWLRFQTGEDDGASPGARGADGEPDRRDQAFWPVIDGTVLPELPFKAGAPTISANKPLIVGGCKDEAVFFHFGDTAAFTLDDRGLMARLEATFGDRASAWFETFRRTRPDASPSQLLMAIETAAPWRAHAVEFAEAKARESAAPVYSYILTYQSPTPVPGTDYPMGCPHAADIVMKFDNARVGEDGAVGSEGFNADQSPARLQTAKNMSALWASFARTGRPSVEGQPEWRPYTLERRETLMIDAQCELVSDPEGEERRFWQREDAPGDIRP